MSEKERNRFQDFFEEDRYVLLKNELYNYRLRKRAVEQSLEKEHHLLILETGSGISPVMTRSERIVYSDLSFSALAILKRRYGRGWYVAADGTNLPFKEGTFSHAICSEVLEHIPDDRRAVQELSRVLKDHGHLVLTIPHRKFLFGLDDRFVKHYRRYELQEITEMLRAARLLPSRIRKVLGPLEKITMLSVIFGISRLSGRGGKESIGRSSSIPYAAFLFFRAANILYAGLAWIDARIMPRNLASVLLISARKNAGNPDGLE